MYRKRVTLPIASLATAAVLAAGCTDAAENEATDPATDPTATEESFNTTDVEFAQQMIPHHAQAVQMAQLAPEQGASPELLDLASEIKAAQQPEIDQLTAMLERWGHDVPSTDGGAHAGHVSDDMAGMMSEADMAQLGESTGAEFDEMWLTMMIEHHEGAVTMAETELAAGAATGPQALAQEIIDAQQAEIDDMEQMLQNSSS